MKGKAEELHSSWINWIARHSRIPVFESILLPFLLVIGVFLLVYLTGGIKYVYSHSMYVVILIAAFFHGTKGGIIFGIIGGIALGPFMPIDITTGEHQQTINWLYRTGFFTLIGALAGIGIETARKQAERINWQSRHETTTGLLNRFALTETIDNAKTDPVGPKPVAFALFSLQNATEIRSSFGFHAMDELILQIASRIREIVKDDKNIFHLHTNMLGVLFLDIEVSKVGELLQALATRVQHQTYELEGVQLHCEIVITCTDISSMEETPDLFLRQCEADLVDAANKPGKLTCPVMKFNTDAGRENLKLLGDLRDSLEQGHMHLHFQPIMDIRSWIISGAEALIRWEHPKLGSIPPGRFIPSVEKSTLIDVLTDWLIDNVLSQLAEWHIQGLDIPLAVNVSTRNLLNPDFAEKILNHLERHKVNARYLEIEITERIMMFDFVNTIRKLDILSGKGIRISIDDFGTGFSSLGYLSRIPAGQIKIDHSFIRNISADERTKQIVDTAIRLAHNLGQLVVAEGVEDRETLDILEKMDCDEVQGFFISHPLPAAEFFEWCRNRNNTKH